MIINLFWIAISIEYNTIGFGIFEIDTDRIDNANLLCISFSDGMLFIGIFWKTFIFNLRGNNEK